MEISVTSPKSGQEAVLNRDLENEINGLSDEVVKNLAVRMWSTDLGNGMRARLNKGSTVEEVLGWAQANVPGVVTPGSKKKPLEKVMTSMPKLDKAGLEELLAEAQKLLAEKG